MCNKFGHTTNNCRYTRGGASSRSGCGTGSRDGVASSYQPMSSNNTRYEPTVPPPVVVNRPSGEMYLVDAATCHANMALSINKGSANVTDTSLLVFADVISFLLFTINSVEGEYVSLTI